MFLCTVCHLMTHCFESDERSNDFNNNKKTFVAASSRYCRDEVCCVDNLFDNKLDLKIMFHLIATLHVILIFDVELAEAAAL